MGYLKKEDVLNNIKSRTLTHNGNKYIIYEAYLGTDLISKKPIRYACRSEAKLHKRITDFYKRRATGGDFALLLSPAQAIDARAALDLLQTENRSMSLTECVKSYLSGAGNDVFVCTTTIQEAYNKYLLAQKDKSEDHKKTILSRVGKWVEVFGGSRLLTEVKPKEVAEDLQKRLCDGKGEQAKTTYNNHLTYIKSFMQWCTYPEQSLLKTNPLTGLKKKVIGWKDKEYLHADDCAKLFGFFDKNKDTYAVELADAILSFFCGMRRAEIDRVRLGSEAVNINLEEKFIRVIKCKGATKGIQPRVFTIPDIAYKWMMSFDFANAVMKKNKDGRRKLVNITKFLGIKLPKNCGRHTFCTMFDAAFHDQMALTAIAGNSEDVREKHYNGLATEKEGKQFFTILPTSTED